MTASPRQPRLALVSRWVLAHDGENWRASDEPLSVAALLADRGERSIDGPPRRFVAESWHDRRPLDAPAEVLAGGGRPVLDDLATCCDGVSDGATILVGLNMSRSQS